MSADQLTARAQELVDICAPYPVAHQFALKIQGHIARGSLDWAVSPGPDVMPLSQGIIQALRYFVDLNTLGQIAAFLARLLGLQFQVWQQAQGPTT